MYCLLEIQSPQLRKPHWIEKDLYIDTLRTLDQSHDLLDITELFSFFVESYEELRDWCLHIDTGPEYIMRNKHMAERKCRGVLLELKTYFLQIKSKLERRYGENSAIYKMFVDAEADAKSNDLAFAFVMDLKECANHCNAIVHSFVVSRDVTILSPCCIPAKLLSDYGSWTKKSKKYLSSASGNIDLLDLYESVYTVLRGIQKQMVGSLLEMNQLQDKLLQLRSFMDAHFTNAVCNRFHLAHMVYQNGKDAPKFAFYQKKVSVKFDAHPVDWKVLYNLTDMILDGQEVN